MQIVSKATALFILRQLRDILAILLFSIGVTYVMVGNSMFSNILAFYKNTIYGFSLALPLWKGNQLTEWFVKRYHPWSVDPKKTLRSVLISSFLFSLTTIILVHYIVLKYEYDRNLFDEFRRFVPQMFMVLTISLLVTIGYYVAAFFKWWRLSVINEAKLQKEAIQLRYDALKSQVNPHFLFNSLSVLSSLIDTDTQKAKSFIQQFSKIYRYVLEQRDKELVPVAEELEFIKSYVNLHLTRHGSSLNVNIDIEDTSGYIIPLSLQILLENCFKHNIISQEQPLNVRVWRESSCIVVQNNLQKRGTFGQSAGIGLETLCSRYSFLSNQKVEVIVDSMYFTVKVPVLQNSL